jgi:hypothetical protein
MLPAQKALIHRQNFKNQPTAEQLRLGALKHSRSCLWDKDFAKKKHVNYRI